MSTKSPPGLFARGTWTEARRIGDVLRTETTGGVLLLGAAVLALVWANSPWSGAYHDLSSVRVGPASWHLDLTLAGWAADGLLAVFFFIAGLELKREFVAGDLRDRRRAVLPVAAAVGGMAIPALVYVAVNAGGAHGSLAGWAVPTATDIAFALAVLAVISTHLPAALRTFLLTLAVVDDLLAITSSRCSTPRRCSRCRCCSRCCRSAAVRGAGAAAGAVVVAAAPAGRGDVGAGARVRCPRHGRRRAARRSRCRCAPRHGRAGPGLAEHFEHRWRPLSAAFAVPVFAFFAAGVPSAAGGLGVPHDATRSRSASSPAWCWARPVGILGATWLVQRFTRARLADGLSWWDVFGLALLGRDRVHGVAADRRAGVRDGHASATATPRWASCSVR